MVFGPQSVCSMNIWAAQHAHSTLLFMQSRASFLELGAGGVRVECGAYCNWRGLFTALLSRCMLHDYHYDTVLTIANGTMLACHTLVSHMACCAHHGDAACLADAQ